ncbi:hypothetical protein [Parvibaculum sp.]|uniref:hypothetical protein n=1 Tax=Parvibaculum sp. TaxID=2024848 RepID=UPI00391CB2C6
MKRNVVLVGLAAALGLAALPVPANAVAIAPAIGVNGAAQVELAHGYNHHRHHRSHGYHHAPPPVVHHYHHRKVRPWAHWRPYMVRHHYYVVGQPVYYSSHPHYGPYYRVRARDRDDVLLWIGISAITGAILFSNY